MPENAEAFELWLEVKTQWRAAAYGLIGLDYGAVYTEAKRLDIELSPCTMKKIKALEAHVLKEQAQHVERQSTGGSKIPAQP